MSKAFQFTLLIALLCSATASASCTTCRQFPGTVELDCSVSSSHAVDSALPQLTRFCQHTFPGSFALQSKCLSDTAHYLSDLHKDKRSESEHENEVVLLSASRLCFIVAECETPCCLTDYVPEQIHLATGFDYTQMVVSWVTYQPLNSPVVYFWKAGSSDPTIHVTDVVASTSTYDAGGWKGTIYNATLTNLEAASHYEYRLGGSGSNFTDTMSSVERRFTTPAAFSAAPLTARSLQAKVAPYVPGTSASVVAYFGDMSTTTKAHETATSLDVLTANRTVQMVIQGGDLSYADGEESLWDEYMRMVQPFADRVPVMTAPGNHENYYLFDAYKHRFFMPWAASHSPSKQYYSFNHEKIHFVSWSFEELDGVDLRDQGRQREWLEADLAQANLERDVRPWVVLFGHRPFYCSSDSHDCDNVAVYLRDLLEDLINEYHIDVVLQSHKHNYERTYPVYQSEPMATNYEDPQAPMYYVVGTGGKEKNTDFKKTVPSWSAHQDTKYGYLLLSAPDQYSLEMAYVSKSYTLHDSATITRSNNITDWTFSH